VYYLADGPAPGPVGRIEVLILKADAGGFEPGGQASYFFDPPGHVVQVDRWRRHKATDGVLQFFHGENPFLGCRARRVVHGAVTFPWDLPATDEK
jgi:hypothetical protein